MSFAAHYVLALCAVALTLYGLHAATRAFTQRRISGANRIVTLLESTPLAPNATLHVVRVGERRFLIGAGGGQVRLLAEIPRSR